MEQVSAYQLNMQLIQQLEKHRAAGVGAARPSCKAAEPPKPTSKSPIMASRKHLNDLWQDQMQAGDEWHARVRLLLQYNLELKRTLETFSPTYGFTAIPQAQYDEVFQAGLTMAQLHKQLSEHFEAQDIKKKSMSHRRPTLHFIVSNFPSTSTHFCCGATRVRVPCTRHRPFGSLA